MKKKLRAALTAVLTLTLIVGVSGVIWQQINYRQGAADYSDAEELAGIPQQAAPQVPAKQETTPKQEADPQEEEQPEEPEDPEELLVAALKQTDLAALQAVNGDVLGWITIPDTEVNYPLVRRDDNDYYLKHTWKGERSSVGAIFLDYRNSADLSDDNTLIYGHNMKNKSMFGSLKYYLNDGHYEAHPSVYIVDEAGVHRYDIYAIYEASVEAVTYDKTFVNQQAKTDFINYGIRRSIVDTGIVPAAEDHIITLSTCTGASYATRWVVQAVLAETFA